MKLIRFTLMLFCAGLFALQLNAQVQTPAPSPFCKLEQKVGLTDVNIEYSRPGVKDREIFGGLVPYDKPWRTGANSATKVSFSTDAMFGDVKLEAGDYALITTPGKEMWTFHFYPWESGNWSSYLEGGKTSHDVKAKAWKMETTKVETMTIELDDITDNGAALYIIWADVYVQAPFTVPTDEAVMASIEETMKGPSANDYFRSAYYYNASGKDKKQALEWINKSIEMDGEKFWVLRQKSLIQADLGMKQEAIATAKRSKELAMEAGNDEYVKMNSESIEEWSN